MLDFGERIGLDKQSATRIVDDICGHAVEIEGLVRRSFLSHQPKGIYLEIVEDRRRALQIRDFG